MSNKVTIIDYGVGNIFSVRRAFEHCGAEVLLTDSINEILTAERLVLPGVGAFVDGMEGLKSRNLIEPIKQYAATGRPFLGICLGMQMLLDSSEEFGLQKGLGLIAGNVVAIPATGADGNSHKIPHIGWNDLLVTENGGTWRGTILENTKPGSSVYFVHSFQAVPQHQENRLADCNYNGRVICAVVRSGSVYGCQFHPEKSGEVGLEIIRRFLTI
jgi:glutamine amidotransferase